MNLDARIKALAKGDRKFDLTKETGIVWHRNVSHLAFVRELVVNTGFDWTPRKYWKPDCEILGYSEVELHHPKQRIYFLIRPPDSVYMDGLGPEVARDWHANSHLVDPASIIAGKPSKPPRFKSKPVNADEQSAAQACREHWAQCGVKRGHATVIEPSPKRWFEFWK